MAKIKFASVLMFHNLVDEKLVVMGFDEDYIKVYNIHTERDEFFEIDEFKTLLKNKEIEILKE